MSPRLSIAAMAIAAPLLVLGACQKSTSSSSATNPVVSDTVAPPPAQVEATRAATATSIGPQGAPVVSRAEFAKAAAIGDLYEIQAGRLAERRSHAPAIRSFAASMVRDHTAADENLGKTLGADGVGIGVTPATGLDAPHEAMIDRLDAASPADFDKTYIDQQVKAHQQAADLFNGYAQGGDAAPLKAFAIHGLPMIDSHLARARQIQVSLATGAGPANPSPQ